jgi:hypothetical protein
MQFLTQNIEKIRIKMEQPQDVNLAHLSKYLGKSKALMDATPVTSGGGQMTEGSYDPNQEKPLPDLTNQYISKINATPQQTPINDEAMYGDAVNESNLPPVVKQAMLKNRINNVAPGYVPEATPRPVNQTQQAPQKQMIQEHINTPANHGFSKEQMKDMMKEVLAEMMMETISETTIKKTLGKMLSEGKLKIKTPK